MNMRPLISLLLLGLLAGCSHLPQSIKNVLPQDKPATKEAAEKPAGAKAEQELATGINFYQNANYVAAQRSIQSALDQGLPDKQDKLNAYKHLAFIACLNQRQAECRSHFRSALQIDPNFNLTPAEIGHPLWGPVFRSTKQEMSKKKTR